MEQKLAQLALVCYALELVSCLLPAGRGKSPALPPLFIFAFHFNMIAFFSRWRHCGYPPFSNLHEVMLLLTVFSLPVYWIYRRAGDGSFLRGAVCGGAAVYLVYPAFVSDGLPRPLMPALQSPWFIPHVSAYMIAYFMLSVAGVLALREVAKAAPGELLRTADRMARHAFFFLTFGLVSGAMWAQEAWGTYWGWDPKEVWSLVSWLVYVYYFHHRLKPGAGRRLQAGLLVVGLAAVLVTFFVVNLSRIFSGLHSYS